MIRTYKIQALGCKVNQYDAQQIKQLFNQYGVTEAEHDQVADVVLLHSCAVTATAVQKSRQQLRKLARENPNAQVLLTGCAAEKGLSDELICHKVPAGANLLANIAKVLETLPLPAHQYQFNAETDEQLFPDFEGQTRAFLKVQDGCDHACTYCIIWKLRKAPRDKPIAVAVSEAENLVDQGYRELVVTGIHLGLYGRESGESFADLLSALCRIPGLKRVRIGSLHPNEITDTLLAIWKDHPDLMPHFHLSLQSGSTETLEKMGRDYTAQEVLERVAKIRDRVPSASFTCDLIVGFPTETDAQFEESYALCEQIGFAHMHIFSFSARPGTPAAEWDPLPSATIQQRMNRMTELEESMRLAQHQQMVGQSLEVLVERNGTGYTANYLPCSIAGEEGAIVSAVCLSADQRSLRF